MKNIKLLAASVALPLAGAVLISIITNPSVLYDDIIRPPLSPPSIIFPIVWTILYTLMGIALYRVLVSGKSKEEIYDAKRSFSAQLILNYLWVIIFFGFRTYYAAILCLVLLIIMIYVTYQKFREIDTLAATLLIPYLLWCIFALYLNISISILN